MLRYFYTKRKALPAQILLNRFTDSALNNWDKPDNEKFQADFLWFLNNSVYICRKKKRTLNLLLKLIYGQLITYTELYWNIYVVNCTYIGVRRHIRKQKYRRIMRRIKLITISIFLLVTNLITGQTLYARGEIHKISSFNKRYFLRTVPNEDAERTKIGNTIVYKADSTELYKFPRYFEFGYFDQQVFLSNDGSTVTNIANGDLSFYNYQQKCITIYKNGKLFKEYALHDIIDCDSKDHRECELFYFAKDAVEKVSYEFNRIRTLVFKKNATNFEKQLTRNPLYQCNDTLLIFCKLGQIIKLNLTSGEFIKEKLINFEYNLNLQIP